MDINSGFLLSEEGYGLLRELFKRSGEGLIITDREGTIRALNPRAESMFGYTEKELQGQKVEVLVPAALRDRHRQHRKGYASHPDVRSMGVGLDLSGVRKDGTFFPIEISLTYLKHEDFFWVVAFVTDITVRKTQERQLEKYAQELEGKVKDRTRELEQMNMGLQSQIQERKLAEKALQRSLEEIQNAEKEILKSLDKEKELNELKSRFVSMASHEFRTPLTTIGSSANLIRKYTRSSEQPQRDKHVNRIINGVKNLTGILNDFLSLEKLESGVTRIDLQPIDLNEVVDEIIQEMTPTLKKGQEIQFQSNGQVSFRTDEQLIKNLFYNLISNASKYSDEGDPIHIRCNTSEKYVSVEIQDRGIGIPENEQKNLFSRFFRAGNVMNIQGTGLGLHIVKKYVNLLNGEIAFESEEGKGSIFKVNLPNN